MKTFWDGKGSPNELAQAFFTKQNGVPVGRPYVRQRVKRYLAASWQGMPAKQRNARIAETLTNTVDNDAWLRPLNHQLVTAVARDAYQWWLWNGQQC